MNVLKWFWNVVLMVFYAPYYFWMCFKQKRYERERDRLKGGGR